MTDASEHGLFIEATVTLERLDGNNFVVEDTASTTQFAEGGAGDVLLRAPWSYTLASGTYRVRFDHRVFVGATGTLDTETRDGWSSTQLRAFGGTSEEFTCGYAAPTISFTATASTSSGQTLTLLPSIDYPLGWSGDVSFKLAFGPASMIVDDATGEITFMPDVSDGSARSAIIAVESGGELIATESIQISVSAP